MDWSPSARAHGRLGHQEVIHTVLKALGGRRDARVLCIIIHQPCLEMACLNTQLVTAFPVFSLLLLWDSAVRHSSFFPSLAFVCHMMALKVSGLFWCPGGVWSVRCMTQDGVCWARVPGHRRLCTEVTCCSGAGFPTGHRFPGCLPVWQDSRLHVLLLASVRDS